MSETSRPPLAAARLPLIGILAAVAFSELALNRLFVRLLHLEPLSWNPRLLRLLDDVSLFVYELVSVLSVLLLLAALVRISAFGKNYRAGARLSFPLVGGVTAALAILGVIFRLPAQLVFHLHLSFVFLGLLVVLTVLSSTSSWNIKLGTALVFLGFLLRLAPPMARRYSSAPLDPALVEGLDAGFLVLVTGASLCFLQRSGSRLLASILTWVTVCGAALFMRADFEDAARVAAYGFDLDLPSHLWGQGLALLALGFGVNTMVHLLSTPGVSRLRGWGLLLMGLGGLQLTLPYQVSLAAIGLLCLAEASVRPSGREITREAFEQLLKEAAASVGATRVTVTGVAGAETVRLHAAPKLSLILRRRAGAIEDLVVQIGDDPPRDPPFTVERRGEGRLGPRGEGELVEVGDPAFDAQFFVRDRRDVGARLLDDATRANLLALCHGWLGIWPKVAIRYHARDATDLPQLLPFLNDLAKRAD